MNRSESVNGALIRRLKTEWEGTYIEVSGSAPVINKYQGDVQRNRNVAQNGAKMAAQAALVQAISATRITQQQTMLDGLSETRIESFVRGSVMPGVEYLEDRLVKEPDGELWKVKIRMAKTVLLNVLEESVGRR